MHNFDPLLVNKNNPPFSLYWRISIILFLLLLGVGAAYVFITTIAAKEYVQEINQQLHGNLADYMVQETKPLKNGQPDTAATHDIMHSIMVINHSAEVYLLDTTGKIIDYVVPFNKVNQDRVNLAPVKDFITTDKRGLILGDDPKKEGKQNVFSAASIYENEQLAGYAYIILGSEEEENLRGELSKRYLSSLGGKMFFLILGAALLIGVLAFWFITKNLRTVFAAIRKFQEGDYKARIPIQEQGDVALLGSTFNEMAGKIDQSITQLKSVDELRKELIANVSHDLRTPLSIVQGYVETLLIKDGQLNSEERKKYLDTVLNSTVKLSKLITQLFEYSKLEAQQISPQKEAFFLQELCQDIVYNYQVLAKEKNIQLDWEGQKTLPMVFADISLVERVLQNLLDNALKFSPAGSKVILSLANTENGVEVKISDSGPGIPEGQETTIFERYAQVGAKPQSNKGAGLGLAIVKKILDIHQVSIHVQNRSLKGAEFWFQLPKYA